LFELTYTPREQKRRTRLITKLANTNKPENNMAVRKPSQLPTRKL